MNSEPQQVGSLTGAGTVTCPSGPKTLTISNTVASIDDTFSGSVGGSLNLVKAGPGTNILAGTAAFTQPSTVSGGTLLINSPGTWGGSSITVDSGATFGGSGTVSNTVTCLSGASAEFTEGSPLTIVGALVLNNNTVNLNLPANLGSGSYTLATYTASGSSGSFNATPNVLTGSFAAGAIVTVTNGAGQVVLNVQACTAAGISQNPSSVTAFIGGTATFSVTATGSNPTYDWQVNTGSGFADVSGGTGQGTASYTTPTLTGAENGWTYQCIVSVACDTTSQTSTAATLTEVNPSTYSFESVTSGNWNSTNTWNQSVNGGATWSPATSTPFSGNSNILIQAGNTVTVTAPVTIDHTVIQSGGEVDVSGAILTITGSSTPDLDVSGNLMLLAAAGSAVTESGTPDVKFENGSTFNSELTTATAVPTATWATNSTCSIAPSAAGAAVPTGLTGQTFGNFVWNWPTQNGSVNLAGALTSVAGNFDVTANSTLDLTTIGDATTYTLTVGGLLDIKSGKGKLAVAGGGPTGTYTIQTGAGLDIETGGSLDWGNHGSNEVGGVTLEMTSNSQFTVSGTTLNPQTTSYLIDAGHTLTLNSSIAVYAGRSVTVNGTLNFQTSQLTAGTTNGGALICNSTCTLIGNGTGQLTTGLGSVTYGGTLNINQASLTGLTSGQSILLFGATSYNTAPPTFASIIPATPPGFASWTDTLDSNGELTVSGTVMVSPKITSTVLSGGNLTLSGTGAPVSDGFTVYGSASLTTPRSSWTSTGVTGTSDGSGNFSAQITGATGSGANQFYTILFN